MSDPTDGNIRRFLRGPNLETFALVVLDVIVIWVSTALAYWVRFEGAVPGTFLDYVWLLAGTATVVYPASFLAMRLYLRVWRHAGFDMVLKLATGVLFGSVILAVLDMLASVPSGLRPVPLGIIVILSAFVFLGTAATRSFARFSAYIERNLRPAERSVVIVGAGDAGSLLLRDLHNRPELGVRAIGFFDDDPSKRGRMIADVRVIGPIEALPAFSVGKHVDEVLVAIPSASGEARRRILNVCAEAGLPVRTMESISPLGKEPGVEDLRQVSIDDLLGREPVRIDLERIRHTVADKVVLVTGAAGSIGSELCRQIVRLGPRKLLLFEIDESRLYELFLELDHMAPGVPEMRLGDIRDVRKTRSLFRKEHPALVFHAAAYKHVPLMEASPDEAAKTNVMGTRNVLDSCKDSGVEHFILISTDKAVMPTSVMGATKAIAEHLTLAACRQGQRASIVRFGNVLGSRGSVVPLFEEQLRRGGPVLVTHPDITRYFMTIPEAARLVLQAQAISEGGEVFVLEMGEPVRIVDLAKKMISLSGVPAEIEFTSLRPAEKLHETLVEADQELVATGSEKILRLGSLPAGQDVGLLAEASHLVDLAVEHEVEATAQLIEHMRLEIRAQAGSAEAGPEPGALGAGGGAGVG